MFVGGGAQDPDGPDCRCAWLTRYYSGVQFVFKFLYF